MTISGVKLNVKKDRLIVALSIIASLTILLFFNHISQSTFVAFGGWLLGYYFGSGRAIINGHKNNIRGE